MTTVLQAPVKGEGRPGYKHTKLGWIPEQWEVKPLGKLATKVMVGIASAATHAYRSSGVLLLRNQNILEGAIDESDVLYIDEEYEKQHQNKRLRGGDIITMRTGYPGVSAVVPSRLEGTQCFTSLITRPDPEQIDSIFLTYYINSPIGKKLIGAAEIGGAQKNMNAGSLEKLPIVYCSLPEQRRIAAVLGAWDRAIATVQQLLAAQQERKRGLMQELLTGRRRFKGFGGKWKEVRLSSVVSKAKGSVVTSNEDPTGTPVIDAGSYEGGATLYSTDTNALRCIDTDVLLLWDGSKAGRAMTGKRGIVGSTFVLLKPKEQIDPGFLTARLTLDEYKIMAIREGSGIPHVPKDFLHWYKFALPPLDEQRAIVGLLNSLDKEAASLKEQLDHLTTQKRGLMQQLLTGAVRVKH